MTSQSIILIAFCATCLIASGQYCYITFKKQNIVGLLLACTFMQLFALAILIILAQNGIFQLDLSQFANAGWM